MRYIPKVLIGLSLTVRAFAFDATIPVVNMQDYYNDEKRDAFVQQVGDALREVGFFAVENPNIDMDLLNAAYDASEEFFHKSLEEKRECSIVSNGVQRGFVESEAARGKAIKDFKEFFHIGHESGADELGRPSNIWPADGAMKSACGSFFQSLDETSKEFQKILSLAMGQDKNFLSERMENNTTTLRLAHYFPNPPKDRDWAAAHTDIDFFTILPKATAEGLQILNKEGQWIPVKVPDNAFIINCGDMLQHMSNREFKSCMHRVKAASDGCERFSMVLFVQPHYKIDLTPTARAITRTGGVQKCVEGTAGELFNERFADLGLASPKMLADLGQSGFLERQIAIGNSSPDAMVAVYNAGHASAEVIEYLESNDLLPNSEE